MFVKFYILVALLVSCEAGYQSRYKSGGTGGGSNRNSATGIVRNRARACSSPRLLNGFVTPLFKGKIMRFDCTKGFSRLGERYSECHNGRWSIYTFPICIKAGCPLLTTPDNGKITYLNAKASAMLFCEPNYEIVGSSFAHCNSTHWDRTVGTCQETDNAPATSCDFESESICGWQHDPDHDFDFERRSGFSNKTITMMTGPHADHTTGVPFQGHYMVINTNTDVFTKRARLISPLYKISAQTMCFKFYYFMYGINLGILRVYMKPESMDLHDVLLEDTESEARNEYLVFEIKGSQGNHWHEGNGFMKPVNESFQIIIEAVSGHTRLSDIAFDDVSVLSDGECLEDEGDDAQPKEADDDDAVFSVESCANRCFETNNTTVRLSANHTLSCSCSKDCDLNVSCCPDFIDLCIKDDDDLTSTTALPATTTLMTPSQNLTTIEITTRTTKTLIPNTTISTTTLRTKTTSKEVIRTTTTTTIKPTTSAPSTIPSTTQATTTPKRHDEPTLNQNATSHLNTTEAPKDYEEVKDIIAGEDEHEVEQDDPSLKIPEDSFESEKLTKAQAKVSFIFEAVIIAIVAVSIALVVASIIFKQYKKSTNPLNYKSKQENGSTKANEEFSEIRYLTSEETLDFNLASAETISDL